MFILPVRIILQPAQSLVFQICHCQSIWTCFQIPDIQAPVQVDLVRQFPIASLSYVFLVLLSFMETGSKITACLQITQHRQPHSIFARKKRFKQSCLIIMIEICFLCGHQNRLCNRAEDRFK